MDYLLPGLVFVLDVLVDVLEGLGVDKLFEGLFPAAEGLLELVEGQEERTSFHLTNLIIGRQ